MTTIGDSIRLWGTQTVAPFFKSAGNGLYDLFFNTISTLGNSAGYLKGRLTTTPPPGPSLAYLIQNGERLNQSETLLQEFKQLATTHGSVFSMGLFRLTYVVSDQKLVNDVLKNDKKYPKYPFHTEDLGRLQMMMGKGLIATASDLEWQKERSSLEPHFQPGKIYEKTGPVIMEQAKWLAESLKGEANISQLGLTYSGRIMANLLAPGHDLNDTDYEEIKTAFDKAVKLFNEKSYKKEVGAYFEILKGKAERLIESALSKDDGSFSLIRELAKTFEVTEANPEGIKKLTPHVINLIAAGFETTATTLSWLFYYLAKDHSIVEKLREEVQYINLAQPIDHQTLNSLTYLNKVIKEVQRIRPILWFNIRYSADTQQLGGHTILKDSQVMLLPYIANHKVDDPEVFNPERTQSEFQPFGWGPRRCLGEYFAKREVQIALIMAVRHANFTPVNDVHPTGGVLLHPNTDIHIQGVSLT